MVKIDPFRIAFSEYLRSLNPGKLKSVALELYLHLQSSRRSEQELIRKLNESRRTNALLAKRNNELHYINESLNDEAKRLRAEINVLQWQRRRLAHRLYGDTYATTQLSSKLPPDESRLA